MTRLTRPAVITAVALVLGGLTPPARQFAADAAPPEPPARPAAPAGAADKRPIQVDDLFKFKRVAAPRISPDGTAVAYQLTTVSLEENKSTSAIWVAATDGKTPPRQLTDPKGKKDAAPRWSPDGKRLLFESNRSGTMQLWVVDAAGGEPRQLTTLSTGADTGAWSPDGKSIAFVSTVYPEFSTKPFAESDRLNKEKDDAAEQSPVKARVFTRLFYRHWNEYVEDKRKHLFVVSASPGRQPGEFPEPRDVTPGNRDAFPTSDTFSSGDDFTFSPDGKFLVFTAVPERNEAWSTNYDICRVSVTNTSPKWECLTKDNPAADSGPKFSPDGKKLAWRAQKRPGNEADRWDIVVADCNPDGTIAGKAHLLLPDADISIDAFNWTVDTIQVNERKEGGNTTVDVVFGLGIGVVFDRNGSREEAVISAEGGRAKLPDRKGKRPPFSVVATSSTIPKGDQALADRLKARTAVFDVVLGESTTMPPDVFANGKNISHANDELLAQLDLPRPESIYVPVEGGVKMQMWVLKPPGFDPAKRYPLVYIVHGGPQVPLNDAWSYRWNPEVWAARGYVVALPNFRGSPGWGQKFVDEISGDWGGKAYRDLVAGLDYLEKQPFVDKDRMAAAGASFGGYMMNWFSVNEISPRFKCLITHCSVWNFESMWGTTDELWFDEGEHGGLPWEVPGKYREYSPHIRAANLGKYKTPMLVIHNDLDFRCPIGQGHELFTALQRQGVPSRMVNFPDEGHWVLKPKNSRYWHQEVFGWLEKYCPPGGK